MNVSILGCGWLGFPLAQHLTGRGHLVKGSTTTTSKVAEMRKKNIDPFIMDIRYLRPQDLSIMSFFDCDILVISVPPRSGDDYPAMILRLKQVAVASNIKRVLFISTTGIYGEPNNFVNELSPASPAKLSARLALEGENILRAEPRLETITLRLGGLIGPGRSPTGFFKRSEVIPNGLAPVNLIHLDDCIGISTLIIETSVQRMTLNGVCPHHPTKMSFYTAAARACEKTPPSFISEKRSWKVVNSRYVKPLLNYEFKVNNWRRWLKQAPVEFRKHRCD